MSVRGSQGLPSFCSGDMYAGVPRTPRVRLSSSAPFASPKSSTLTPVLVSMILAGFRSRWTRPLAWAAAMAEAIWAPVSTGGVDRQRTLLQARSQSLAFQKLHNQKVGPYVVQGADVRMREGRDGARLAFETIAELRAEKLYRHGTVQASVASPKNLTHTAGTEGTLDFIRPEPRARRGLRERVLQSAEGQPCRTVQKVLRGVITAEEGFGVAAQLAIVSAGFFQVFVAFRGAAVTRRVKDFFDSLPALRSHGYGCAETMMPPFGATTKGGLVTTHGHALFPIVVFLSAAPGWPKTGRPSKWPPLRPIREGRLRSAIASHCTYAAAWPALEPQKTSMPVIVIDSIQRPSQNWMGNSGEKRFQFRDGRVTVLGSQK